MLKPNYEDGSIVNLMSSVGKNFGYKSKYKPLKLLHPSELKNSKNILLIILDGVGFEYIKKKGNNTIFQKNLKGKITSVFPPTTAAAIPSITTGVAPQQHAFTGWYMHLKEIGIVSAILPYSPRAGGKPFSKHKLPIEKIFTEQGFASRLNSTSYTIMKRDILNSDFTIHISKKSKRLGYETLNGFLMQVRKTIFSHNRRKYIFAYWPKFDELSHKYGVKSKKSYNHFKQLDKKLKQFIKTIKDTNTTVIIIADHGFIDTTKNKTINLENHPKLQECLTLPLCGEPRTVYCYVHPSKTRQFENYVKTKLNKACYLFKSKELIDKNYFGLFKSNPQLLERIGDYVLIMKDNYMMRDTLLNKKPHPLIGNHGGISKEEMYVPLVVIKT
ncbi:MAG: alkaline phosphatase family protein [Candidatus Woesearchaeota archaeon]